MPLIKMSTVSFKVAQVGLFWRLMITRFITFVVRESNLVMNLISAIISYKEVQLIYLGIIEGTKVSRDGLPYEISSGYFSALMESTVCILYLKSKGVNLDDGLLL